MVQAAEAEDAENDCLGPASGLFIAIDISWEKRPGQCRHPDGLWGPLVSLQSSQSSVSAVDSQLSVVFQSAGRKP